MAWAVAGSELARLVLDGFRAGAVLTGGARHGGASARGGHQGECGCERVRGVRVLCGASSICGGGRSSHLRLPKAYENIGFGTREVSTPKMDNSQKARHPFPKIRCSVVMTKVSPDFRYKAAATSAENPNDV